MEYPAIEIERMSVGERLALIEQVWDSLRRGGGTLPLSEAERAVIETRRAEHRADPGSAVTWEAVRADLLADQQGDEPRTGSTKRR